MNFKSLLLIPIFFLIISSFNTVGTQLETRGDIDCGCNNCSEDTGLTDTEIADLQALIDEKGYSFTVGKSLATERCLENLCGFIADDFSENPNKNQDIKVSYNLPESFSWLDQGKVTEIRDQGNCGTCWAFGTVSILESKILIKEDKTTDLSEQWLISCNNAGYSSDCSDGGSWGHCWHAGTKGKCGGTGAVLENEFPYESGNGNIPSCNGPYTHSYLVKDWAFVENEDSVPSTENIKQAIYEYGPVAAAVYVDDQGLFQAYSSGIFDTDLDGKPSHVIVLVGWNDDPGYWILRNSWGDSWGENGYMRIKYGCQSVGYAANYITDYKTLNLECEGNLNWNEVVPGSTKQGIFTIKNVGESSQELSWEIDSYPDWGTWSFSETSGTGLIDEITIDVSCNTPNEYKDHTGRIIVINSDESLDFDIVPVTLHSISCPDGDLDCIGDFHWTDVPPGDTKQDAFTVKNIGPEDSLLDWEIVSYPSWGMWSFTAEKGKDLENEKNISFAVTVPKNKDKEFSGEIKVVNNNNVDDYDTVPVRIHTSSSKDLIKFFSEFLIQNLPFLKYFLLNSYI